jgi:hypothetical protein
VPAISVVVAQVSALVFGLHFVVIGVFYSSLFKRTARAAISSYATVAAISILPFFLLFVIQAFGYWPAADDTWAPLLLQFSPMVVMGLVVMDWLSAGMPDQLIYWAQSMMLHTLLAGGLYLVAGSRIRRIGKGAAVSLGVLVGLLWVWAIWVGISDHSFL